MTGQPAHSVSCPAVALEPDSARPWPVDFTEQELNDWLEAGDPNEESTADQASRW